MLILLVKLVGKDGIITFNLKDLTLPDKDAEYVPLDLVWLKGLNVILQVLNYCLDFVLI